MSELAFLPYIDEQKIFTKEPLNKFMITIPLESPYIGTAIKDVLPELQREVFGDIEVDYDSLIVYYGKSDGISYASRDIERIRSEIVAAIIAEETNEEVRLLA